MDIKIKQKGGSSYIFLTEIKDFLYRADWSVRFGRTSARIFNKNDECIYKVKKSFNLFKWELKYIIKSIDESVVLKNLNKRHFIYGLDLKDKNYQVYIHQRRQKSIYCNDKQIAFAHEPMLEVLGKDSVDIVADFDADIQIIFLILFCLRIGDSGDSRATVDLGNIGGTESIDLNWKPK